MWYWRGENFRGLSEVIQLLADDADLAEYVEYLRLRERGLRKDAFDHLDRFITAARSWSFGRRCDLVNWLMHLHHDRPSVPDMIPTPLSRELIVPTLDEWTVLEPTNPVPWRWHGGTDNLRRAVALDPNERIARAELANRLLYEVGYAVHELPHGYIGSPFEDTKKLDEVESLLAGLPAAEKPTFEGPLTALREKVQSYMASIGTGTQR
jgi:hypothetical protein